MGAEKHSSEKHGAAKLNVLLVDDQRLMRDGLRTLLELSRT
ncbi:MAG: hypothetical protein R3A10_07180 [Caldilineaceae bacterium]